MSYVARWQSDRNRQPRHAASFSWGRGDSGWGKAIRKVTGSDQNQNGRCVGVRVSPCVCVCWGDGDSASWVQ